MVHEESGGHLCCVCPDCLYRCSACLGTDSVLSREDLKQLLAGPSPLSAQISFDLKAEEPPDDWEE